MMMRNHEIDEETDGFFTTVAADNRQATTVSPPTIVEQCSSCGSTKRRSLFSLSSEEQPIPKRPTLSPPPPPPPSSAVTTTNQFPDGFTKIEIPTSILRRTISEPIPTPQFSEATSNSSNPRSPEYSPPKNLRSPATNPSLPPCILRRTISDPIPALIFANSLGNESKIIPRATATQTPVSLPPLRPILRRILSDSTGSGEICKDSVKNEHPISKELKKMKEMFRMMSQWFSQAIQEEEEEGQEVVHEDSECTHNTEINPKVEEEPESEEIVDKEAVSVKRSGEWLSIQFKCPCAKAYDILLSPHACFYKLI